MMGGGCLCAPYSGHAEEVGSRVGGGGGGGLGGRGGGSGGLDFVKPFPKWAPFVVGLER